MMSLLQQGHQQILENQQTGGSVARPRQQLRQSITWLIQFWWLWHSSTPHTARIYYSREIVQRFSLVFTLRSFWFSVFRAVRTGWMGWEAAGVGVGVRRLVMRVDCSSILHLSKLFSESFFYSSSVSDSISLASLSISLRCFWVAISLRMRVSSSTSLAVSPSLSVLSLASCFSSMSMVRLLLSSMLLMAWLASPFCIRRASNSSSLASSSLSYSLIISSNSLKKVSFLALVMSCVLVLLASSLVRVWLRRASWLRSTLSCESSPWQSWIISWYFLLTYWSSRLWVCSRDSMIPWIQAAYSYCRLMPSACRRLWYSFIWSFRSSFSCYSFSIYCFSEISVQLAILMTFSSALLSSTNSCSFQCSKSVRLCISSSFLARFYSF